MQTVVLDPDELEKKTRAVISQSALARQLGNVPAQTMNHTSIASSREQMVFATPAEQTVAQAAYSIIKKLENQPDRVPTSRYLENPEIQRTVAEEVAAYLAPAQTEMDGLV